MTLRARVGVTAKASDTLSAGVRIATGSTSGSPTSESVTLGNGNNRFAIGIDRAWLRWEPRHGMKLEGGRMAVPFDGTDLLWPDDLGLDGVAGRGELDLASGLFAFATAGAFPLERLHAADEAFTSSSVREVMPVVSVDGHAYESRDAATALQEALRRLATA